MIKVESLLVKAESFTLNASFTLREGEYFCIIGPSGSGKTLLLECLAGLKTPESGRILLNGVDITSTPPHKRGFGYVPQECALFPHLSAKENICFSSRKWDSKLDALCSELGITHLLERKPLTLSGGEVQRVALARALATNPRLLLLDEPFSSLDPAIKSKLWLMLRRLHREHNLTILHVTHDFEEAFVLAERILMLKEGVVQQIGSKKDILMHPANREVAQFTGTKNIFEGKVVERSEEELRITWQGGVVSAPAFNYNVGEKVCFCIRPEHVMLIRPNRELGKPVKENLLHGVIVDDIDRGTAHTLLFEVDECRALVEIDIPKHVHERLGVKSHRRARVSLKRNAIHVFKT
jgi:molybdate transport system ATP-binding protein/molybdate/tungstate transport system ATP-binding protein